MVLTRNGIGLVDAEVPAATARLINVVALFLGPFTAALVVTRLIGERPGALVRRMVQLRASWQAWVLALIAIPAVIAAISRLGPPTAGGPPAGIPADVPLPALMAVLFVIFLMGGPLQEEIGWRGFALPRLNAAMHPVAASVLVGVLWGCWHLPQFAIQAWDTPHGSVLDVVAFLTFTVTASLVLGWIANTASRSVLLPILGHNALNWALTVAPGLTSHAPTMWSAAVGCGLLGLLGIVVTRGTLGLSTPAPA